MTRARRGTKREPARERWFVYVLRCADGSLYTGIARNVDERLAEHTSGKGAKYTRGRGPFEVLATRACMSKGSALRLELAVKALPRRAKEKLVRDPSALSALASRLRRRTRDAR